MKDLFKPEDFKNKDGEYASAEAAALIANRKLKLFLDGKIDPEEDDEKLPESAIEFLIKEG